MAKDKIRRFAEFKMFSNSFDFPYELKGKWKERVFNNNNPLVLELGCGKGEYTVALATRFPEKNFIGIDIKSNRMWKGAGIALEQGLQNAAFARLVIHKITEIFDDAEVDEIWITFPDPFPKLRHAKHRLTHPRFLALYKQILKPGGLVNFKTDADDLFQFTVDMLPQLGIKAIATDFDVHGNPEAHEHLKNIRTHYESLFLRQGKKIKYTSFTLDHFNETCAQEFTNGLEAERKRLSAVE